MADHNKSLKKAIRRFWSTRERQSKKQEIKSGNRDQGTRSAVTGGAQMDGFVELIRNIFMECGVKRPDVFYENRLELPGYFRPEKKWDIVVVVDNKLIAAVELKSQIGPSFGNNFNNRSEEAIGSATDHRVAYREGAFKPSNIPWLGYFMLLEDAAKSRGPIKVKEPHFVVFDEFKKASYAKRYELLLIKLVRERLYDSACLILTEKSASKSGNYLEPCAELSFANFVMSLSAKAIAISKTRSESQG